MATIAGLEFLSATATMQQATGGEWVRAYDLTGHSYGLHFRASFRASDATHQILDLSLAVSPEARSELAHFIATYAPMRDLTVDSLACPSVLRSGRDLVNPCPSS